MCVCVAHIHILRWHEWSRQIYFKEEHGRNYVSAASQQMLDVISHPSAGISEIAGDLARLRWLDTRRKS